MKHYFLLPVMIMLISLPAAAAIIGEEVSYQAGGETMKGYLAYDDSLGKRRGGILVVHEWWGHNDYARIQARKLAKLGYTALAVDMYGNGKQAAHPKDAAAFSSKLKNNLPLMQERFKAAKKLLKDHDTVLNTRIAAIGYCFGGGVVLEMARQGEKLKGVVSFHGSLATRQPAKKGKVRARILILNGEADPFVKAEHIITFKQEMEQAGVDYTYVSYPDAKHAFTNPGATYLGKKFGLPLEYNLHADTQSWKELESFLSEILH
ncbi:MAG: dienelactone hydrolase family protein [Gammaproteobacteria bacterium]|nr:dienelactone hydrolase family protein [Gammaproteobacteria bacterium]